MYPDHNKYDNNNSVADPYHFDVDPVPDLGCEKNFVTDPGRTLIWIRIQAKTIRIRIQQKRIKYKI